jgi:hypothetical protein
LLSNGRGISSYSTLLGNEAVFSVRSVPRLHKKGQLPLEESLEMTIRREDSSEIGDSHGEREAVNTEVEGPTALGAITRQRLANTQQTERA